MPTTISRLGALTARELIRGQRLYARAFLFSMVYDQLLLATRIKEIAVVHQS